ncbi:MAG: hypothetical protein ACE5GN_03945 [Waddliaceae bacterium]
MLRDELSGKGVHQIDRYFHFAPMEVVCDTENKSVHTLSSKEGNVAMIGLEKEGIEVEILQNGDSPQEGWIAPGYDKKVRASVARYRIKKQVPLVLNTLLIPFRERCPDLLVKRLPLDAKTGDVLGQGFSIDVDRRHDVLFFYSGKEVVSFNNGWLTDAHMAWIRLDEKGDVVRCALIDGSTLFVEGIRLLQLSKNVRFAVISFQTQKPCIELSEPAEVSSALSNPSIVITPIP